MPPISKLNLAALNSPPKEAAADEAGAAGFKLNLAGLHQGDGVTVTHTQGKPSAALLAGDHSINGPDELRSTPRADNQQTTRRSTETGKGRAVLRAFLSLTPALPARKASRLDMQSILQSIVDLPLADVVLRRHSLPH
eukprot:1983577-Pleurochrysis_carterae.AAC.1